VRGVDLDVSQGSALGVVGPPGAGKSTLLLLLAGLLRPDRGTVLWFGQSAGDGGRPPGISYVPPYRSHYGFMTVREAVEYHAVLRDLPGKDRLAAVDLALRRVGLTDLARRTIGNLPVGAAERLNLAQVLVETPRILVLDDSLAALDPGPRREIATVLRALAAEGVTIVMASTSVTALEPVVSQIIVMLDGRIVAHTDPATLRRARAIELTVAPAPSSAPDFATALCRTTGAHVAERRRSNQIVRIPLEDTTPEAVLARCRVCGLDVARSRIVETNEP
jgi:ABC-type multidrug transport system ATPase subunit